jgi:hypothetical protein
VNAHENRPSGDPTAAELDARSAKLDFTFAKRQDEGPMCDAALEYAQRGWSVFPAPPGQKKSYLAQKYSGTRWGSTINPKVIRSAFRKFPDANVAIVTGVVSGIFVIEADTVKGHGVDGIASISALEGEHGPFPETLMAISPSGSIHRFYRHPGAGIKVWNSTSKIAPGVDIKGDGGMVIAPPSIKPGVGVYRWLNDKPVADAPAWLLERVTVTNKANKPSSRDPEGEQAQPEKNHFEASGERHSAKADADLEEIEAALMAIPNDASVKWDAWNRIGMAVFSATGGSAAGFTLFDKWSQKYPGYDADDTAAKWEALEGCPPTDIGVGTIFYEADQASPSWRSVYRLSAICPDGIRVEKPDQFDLIEQAIDIFDTARPLRGSLAEKYLTGLGLTVPDAAQEVLRFHPHCRFGDLVLPCLVSYVQDSLTNEPAGLHLTALSPDARAIQRKIIGSVGCYDAIKLGGEPHASAELTLATSIEAGLAAMMFGFSPAWSVLSAQGVADFPKPRFHNTKRLTVIVDSDEAVEAAAKCKARWGNVARIVVRSV